MSRGPLDLVGRWVMQRHVDDRFSGLPADVEGLLELSVLDDGRVRWHETGTMVRDGARMPVTRTLYVVPQGDTWMVTFDDGREFHPWRPGETVDHPCGNDLYRGVVDSTGDEDWSVVWEVSGPIKDYTMTTHLTLRDS